MQPATSVIGWAVLVLLALAFLLFGVLEHLGVSDRPDSNGWQLLALAAVFTAAAALTFPF